MLAVLAGPVQAQQLVIPATIGTEACTEGNQLWTAETRSNVLGMPSLPTQSTFAISTSLITATNIRSWLGLSDGTEFTVTLDLVANGTVVTSAKKPIGTTNSFFQNISARTSNYSSLKKNTRYVATLHTGNPLDEANILARRCFKTRGEFTPAEQNLVYNGEKSEWQPNLARYNRTGCYAVASTRQDIRDCYCNGTRNGTHILAGQTTASQAQRQYLNCPDLDS